MRITAFWAVILLVALSLGCNRGGKVHGKLNREDSLRVELESLTKQISENDKDGSLFYQRAKVYISLKEINPHTMESKKLKGLYFCGEVMDLDAGTGGYNLQAAFSTGYTAGESAAVAAKPPEL